jgi:uncharacterized membrane protein YccC
MAVWELLSSGTGAAPGWSGKLRRQGRRLFRRWKREDFVLGGRLAVVAVAAMLLARTIGLHSFYWAGISAIIVSTGTPGGSFASSLARAAGTLVGLASGLGAVLLLGHNLPAAALAIPVAILLCRALGLKAAIKVGALTTLFPISVGAELHGLGPTLATSLARAENVLVGCAVTTLLDGFVWPGRISRKFQKLLRVQMGRVGSMAATLLEAYVDGRPVDAGADLALLQQARFEHLQLMQELTEEPEDAWAPKDYLTQQMDWVHELVDHCCALHSILQRMDGDRVQWLVAKELADLAGSLRAAGLRLEQGLPEPPEAPALADSRSRLEQAFEGVRGDCGTLAFAAPEVFRLLGVMHLGSCLAEGLARLGAGPAPEP